MYTMGELFCRPVHLYQRHKQHRPHLQQLHSRNIFHQRQRIFLHRLDNLRSRSEDSCQRHRYHRPYLRSMPERAVCYRNQPEHLHELDRMQRYHGSGKQRGFCDSR